MSAFCIKKIKFFKFLIWHYNVCLSWYKSMSLSSFRYARQYIRINKRTTIIKNKSLPTCFFCWRRDRDSNPRMLSHQRFSRPPLSTAQPSLHNLWTLPLYTILQLFSTVFANFFFFFIKIYLLLFFDCLLMQVITIFGKHFIQSKFYKKNCKICLQFYSKQTLTLALTDTLPTISLPSKPSA